MLTLLGVGAFLANRNPIRHILWLRLTIGFLFGIALYASLVYWGGGISRVTRRSCWPSSASSPALRC